jgi:hypothetical protein
MGEHLRALNCSASRRWRRSPTAASGGVTLRLANDAVFAVHDRRGDADHARRDLVMGDAVALPADPAQRRLHLLEVSCPSLCGGTRVTARRGAA